MRMGVAGAALMMSLCACAPVTMSPMAIRMGPSDMKAVNAAFGLRTGPRLSASLVPQTAGGGPFGGGGFSGDSASFNLSQWAAAYDLILSRGITETTALHIGGQGEFYYPVPLPAYGVYAGLSQYHRFGRFAVGPSFTARGATDFGLGVVGGPGTIVGAEASCSLGVADDRLPIAVVPFYGLHAVLANGSTTPSHYAGAAFALQAHFRAVYVEVTGGFGRVFQQGTQSWNAPIIGVRIGH